MTPAVGKLTPDQRRQIAANFIASAKWGRLSMRGGSATPANEGVSRVTMRVFAKGCPAGCLRDVLQILAEKSPVTDPLLDASLEPGEWFHKAAWWGKDSQSSKNGDPTVTLFRELSDGPVSETNVVEDGCGSRTTIRFVWDAASVDTLEAIGHSNEQGFSVKVGGVTRDRETEQYSYYVTTTERKTQTVPAYETGDDAFSTDYDASWLGLRGTVASPTDDEGGGVSVWDPAVQAPGESLGVQWSRNLEDCTLNAQGRRKVAKPGVASSEACAKTLFAEQDTDSVSGAVARLGHAPEPASGVSWHHQSKLRPDRLWDTVKSKDTERPVEDAEVTVSEDLYRRVERKASKSQPADASDALLPSSADGVIVSYQKGKTPGKLRDVTETKETEKRVDGAETSSASDLFGTEESETSRSVPEAEAAALVPSFADGSVTVIQKSRTKGGRRDVTKKTAVEATVTDADVVESVDLFTERTQSAHKSLPAADADLILPGSGDGTVTGVRKGKTRGDRRDVTVTVDRELTVLAAETSRSVDAYQRVTQTTDKSVDAVAADALAPSVVNGVIVKYQKGKTRGKRRDVTRTELTETTVEAASVTRSAGLLGTRVTIQSKSMPAPPAPLAAGVFGSTGHTLTPGGMQDTSVTTFESVGDGTVLSQERGGDFESTFERTETVESRMEYPPTGLVSPGFIREVTFTRRDETGVFIKSVTETTAIPHAAIEIYHHIEMGPFGGYAGGATLSDEPGLFGTLSDERIWLFINSTQASIAAVTGVSGFLTTGYRHSFSLSVHPNRFGLWSGTVGRTVIRTA